MSLFGRGLRLQTVELCESQYTYTMATGAAQAHELLVESGCCCCISSCLTSNCFGVYQSAECLCCESECLCCKRSATEGDCCVLSQTRQTCVQPKTCCKAITQCFCIDSRCAIPCDKSVPCVLAYCCVICCVNYQCACRVFQKLGPLLEDDKPLVPASSLSKETQMATYPPAKTDDLYASYPQVGEQEEIEASAPEGNRSRGSIGGANPLSPAQRKSLLQPISPPSTSGEARSLASSLPSPAAHRESVGGQDHGARAMQLAGPTPSNNPLLARPSISGGGGGGPGVERRQSVGLMSGVVSGGGGAERRKSGVMNISAFAPPGAMAAPPPPK